jgi:hypothetical protein
MNRVVISAFLLFAASGAEAQLQIPPQTARPVADASMVIMDRGSQLEILPTSRAVPKDQSNGGVSRHRVVRMAVNAPINAAQLGVVFNHAMQQEGYFTGEIAFKMKAGEGTANLGLQRSLKKLGSSDAYVTRARTPKEFISLLKSLQNRSDLEWVEPTIIYGARE